MQEPAFPANEQLRIDTLRGLKIVDTPAEDRFDRLTEMAKRLFDVPIVLISIIDDDREWFKSAIGVDLSQVPRSISFCGHAILQNEIFIVNDTLQDDRFADNPFVIDQPEIRFYAGSPIAAANGQMIGALCIADDKPRSFPQQEQNLLNHLARLVEREINFPDLKILNKKLLQSERELLNTIAELRQAQSHSVFRNKSLELISRGYPLFEVLNSIALEIEHQNPELSAAIMVLDHSGSQLCVGAAPSLPDYFVDAIQNISIADGGGACAMAARSGNAVISRDMLPEINSANLQAISKRSGITSTWAEPINAADGTILGILSLYRRDLQPPEESDLQLINQSTNLISIAIERDQTDRRIWRQANYDSLTRLPNRNLFRERINQEILNSQRNQQSMALLFIDLDHFKEVNDSLGHIKGDDLLVQTATRLSNCVRQIDTVARLGGDEFTIIMGELDSRESVERVAEKVISVLSEKFILDRETAYLSASIGIAFYPDHGEDSDSLILSADRAMYIAKNRGRSRFCIYNG